MKIWRITVKKNRKPQVLPVESQKGLRPLRQVLDIPLDQLAPDPHQPRETFNQNALEELAKSIKKGGLQQYPTVNFSYFENEKPYYVLKTGERRWRAHKLLGLPTMTCVVESEVYLGERSVARRLAQATENFSREPHTHQEIINIVEEIVDEEVKKRGQVFGSIQIALTIVATAFGKSLAWATNYHTLAGLLPGIRKMMDTEEEDLRLSFAHALCLARIPHDVQEKEFEETQRRVLKGGGRAGHAYIVSRARQIRESRGEKMRGRGYDEKIRFIKYCARLHGQSLEMSNGRKPSEQVVFLFNIVSSMSVSETDVALAEIKQSIKRFTEIQSILQAKRDLNYRDLTVNPQKA